MRPLGRRPGIQPTARRDARWIPGSRFASPGMTKREITSTRKRPGSLPAFSLCITLDMRSLLRFRPLRRGRRPRLHQRVVVNRLALRLLVRQLALGRDVAVLLGLLEPELGRLLLVQLRPALLLHAGLLKTFE